MHQQINIKDSGAISKQSLNYAMNYEHPYLAYIRERLYDWAEWYSQCNFFGIGYASRSIEHRLMMEGAIINSTAPRSFNARPDAEEMENYLHEMFQQEPEMAIVMRWRYFFPNDSFRTLATKLTEHGFECSYTSVQTLFAKAHHWLEGRMTAKQKYTHLWVSNPVDSELDKLQRNVDRYVH